MSYEPDLSGFDELADLLKEYEITDEKVMKALETGASLLTTDARRLPRPRSSLSGTGYTHLIDTITFKRNKKEIEVGWGKYYGPMVEKGTKRMRGTPHITPLFMANKEKYYQVIEKQLFK